MVVWDIRKELTIESCHHAEIYMVWEILKAATTLRCIMNALCWQMSTPSSDKLAQIATDFSFPIP